MLSTFLWEISGTLMLICYEEYRVSIIPHLCFCSKILGHSNKLFLMEMGCSGVVSV